MTGLDIARVPFSRRGSWMSVALLEGERAPAGRGLYLRSHHGGNQALFQIIADPDGAYASWSVDAAPHLLRLSTGRAACVELCFDGPDTVRIRGKGLGLELRAVPWSVVYAESADLTTFNLRPATRRYQFERLCGRVVTAGVQGQPLQSIKLEPDHTGSFEVAVDEYWSTWENRIRVPFEECAASSERDFARFLDTMPAGPDELRQTRALAAYVNWSAIVSPCGLLRRPAMLMSRNWMCSVWSWDHCFNAIALASGQPQLALDQLLVVMDHQDRFGCYPDAVNDINIHYNFAKPPVHAWAVAEVLSRLPEPADPKTVRALYRSLRAVTRWWLERRRLPGQRLPYYLHGNDSGWDNSTMFDRGVPLVAPDLAAFLVLQMDVLSGLADQAGQENERARWKRAADELFDALLSELWREDRFVAKLARGGDTVESESLIPCVPIVLGKRLPEPVRAALARSIEQHLTEWGLATEPPDSERYEPDGYWRGPIWAPSTYLIVYGLGECGFDSLALTVAERFCRLCAKSGLAENYDALTGAPLRDPAYTWTASAYLLLAELLAEREAIP